MENLLQVTMDFGIRFKVQNQEVSGSNQRICRRMLLKGGLKNAVWFINKSKWVFMLWTKGKSFFFNFCSTFLVQCVHVYLV